MSATPSGVENHRRSALADIVKGRQDQLVGELKEAGAPAEDIASVVTPPVDEATDDPKRPKDIALEEWSKLSDEEKGNAIKSAEAEAASAEGETEEQKVAREAEEKRLADEEAAKAKKTEKLKIDGQEQDVEIDKILEAGRRSLQKDMAADKRLEEASRLKKEAEAALEAARAESVARQDQIQDGRTPPQGASAVDKLTDETYTEAVKAIQYGGEAEAKAALQGLISKAVSSGQTESLTLAEVNEMLEFRDAMKWASDEFKDLLGDPKLKALFSQEEKRMRATGDMRPYRELYQDIGSGLREWRKGIAPEASAPKSNTSISERRERKASVVAIPSAAARQPAPQETKEPTPSETIAKIRAGRGQT